MSRKLQLIFGRNVYLLMKVVVVKSPKLFVPLLRRLFKIRRT